MTSAAKGSPSPRLTRNQAMVYDALVSASGAMTAYQLLDALRAEGLNAPPQIYRALQRLTDIGLVHRLESTHAFVACQHGDGTGHDTAAFAICDDCGDVVELSDARLARDLRSLADGSGFTPHRASIELHGTCERCRPAND